MKWPNDSDGEVLRDLERAGFDFSVVHDIDFQVRFERWPPSAEAIEWLEHRFGAVQLFAPEVPGGISDVQVTVRSELSYDFVVGTQATISKALARYDGSCTEWGVEF